MKDQIDNDADLNAALATYSGRVSAQSWKSKVPSMLGYTAAAGGLAFTGGDAVGSVVYNGTSRPYTVFNAFVSSSFVSAGGTFNIDLDGAGGADLAIYLGAQASGSGFTYFTGLAQATYGGSGDIAVSNVTGNRGNAVNLLATQFVGAGLTF